MQANGNRFCFWALAIFDWNRVYHINGCGDYVSVNTPSVCSVRSVYAQLASGSHYENCYEKRASLSAYLEPIPLQTMLLGKRSILIPSGSANSLFPSSVYRFDLGPCHCAVIFNPCHEIIITEHWCCVA